MKYIFCCYKQIQNLHWECYAIVTAIQQQWWLTVRLLYLLTIIMLSGEDHLVFGTKKKAISPCSSSLKGHSVSPGETSAPQRQKFRTHWWKLGALIIWIGQHSSYTLYYSVLALNDRQMAKKATKVKCTCKCAESFTKQSIFVEYIVL